MALIAAGVVVAASAVLATTAPASAADGQGVTSFTATPVEEGGVRSVKVSGAVSLVGIDDLSSLEVVIAANSVLVGAGPVNVDASGNFSTVLTGDNILDARYIIDAQAYYFRPDANPLLGSKASATAMFGTDDPVPSPQPAPAIHLSAAGACLTDDGVTVKPFGVSFTWNDPESRQFDFVYIVNAVNTDGSLGAEVHHDRGMAPIGHFEEPDISASLSQGTFAVTAYVVDYYSRLSSVSPGGAIGGGGSVNGEAATAQFTVGHCDSVTPSTPAISLSSDSVKAEDALTVSVTGAHPGEQLTFTLHSDVVQLGTATADDNGSATLTAKIPSTVPTGAHTVMVDGEVTHLAKTVTVTASSATTDDPVKTDPKTTEGTHKTPTTVQTDGNPSAVLWLTLAAMLLALTTAGGAGVIWPRARR